MKTISKRISAVLLSFYMVFGVVSSDYLTVQAFEWVVPSLTVGDSILWLMGLLGMTYTEGSSAWRDVSPEYEQEFIDYANEHGLTYTQTNTWLNDVAIGKLDQLSEVWTNFKEWVKSKFTTSSVDMNSLKSICSQVGIVAGREYTVYPLYCLYTNYSVSDFPLTIISLQSADANGSCSCTFNSSTNTIMFVNTGTVSLDKYRISSSGSITKESLSRGSGIGISLDNVSLSYLYGLDSLVGFPSTVHPWDISDSDSDFEVYNAALISDINFAGANTEDASIPGVIDLPWGNLGDDEEERDKTYDDLVGGLDLGKEIGDLWQALQDLMGVLAVDDTGVLQPNSGGENPPTLEDEAEKNKVNGAFVLTGLQKVFPFCIPFDLYAFITLLEAPPVAPVIEYPIYNPVTKSNEIITIDFSTWESVVVLFRYIFDFLFIIGLLLMARALIGGGDSA